jgi:2-methylcitrate dehydratase
MRGITGPLEVFEGNKGFMEAIAGRFALDWAGENLERVTRTILKKYNAEIHSQSALEGILELRDEHGLAAAAIEAIEIEIFDVAYHIIGGGAEGDKVQVATKEEADHSLPYMVAVAALDGQVLPDQYSAERIRQKDVQQLLRRVRVRPRDDYSQRFPAEMPCRLVVRLRDGRAVEKVKRDYEGFFTRPMAWETAAEKFRRLSTPHIPAAAQEEILQAVANLERLPVAELTRLLENILSHQGRTCQ